MTSELREDQEAGCRPNVDACERDSDGFEQVLLDGCTPSGAALYFSCLSAAHSPTLPRKHALHNGFKVVKLRQTSYWLGGKGFACLDAEALDARSAPQPGTACGSAAANGRSALGTAAAQAAAALPQLPPTRYGAHQAARDDQALPLLSGGALSTAGGPGSAHLEVEGAWGPRCAAFTLA